MSTLSVRLQKQLEQGRYSQLWSLRVVEATRIRGRFLWLEVDFDVAEVIVVGALWANLANRLGYLKEPHAISIYRGLNMVLGADVLTGALLFLAIVGLLSVFLILPSVRRAAIMAIGAYFFLSGIIFFVSVPGNLSGWYHVFIFAPLSAWVFWRLGEEVVSRDRPGYH